MLKDFKSKYSKKIPYNFIVDNLIKPVPFKELERLKGIELKYFYIESNNYKKWVYAYFPKWRKKFKNIQQKKLVEFYATFTLLNPSQGDVFMDSAGGADTYLMLLKCNKRYLQDIHISEEVKFTFGSDIEYIQSNVDNIPLPEESIDKLSCHHSFEHFQGDIDILFLKEIQRLLKPRGKCCVIPIFIADRYVEITDSFTFDKKYDFDSERIIDPTSLLPGGDDCGNYARVYNIKAFEKRVIKNIDFDKFKVTIAELVIDRKLIPDLALKCHKHITRINYPYRLLLIAKL